MAGFQITEIVEVGPGWNKVRLSDGNVYTLDGNYNWRSNNPGNIEWGDFARSQGALGPGAVPPGRDRAFAIFPTYEQGRQAKERLLFTTPGYLNSTKGGYPQGSIGAAISRYAPDFENNTGGYIKAITDALGVDANAKLSDLSPAQRVTMLNTMERVEGYAVGDMFNETGIKLPPAEIPNVVASALDATPVLGKRNVLSTTPSGIDEAYRYTNTATGDLLPNQNVPKPAMRQGMVDVLKQGPKQRVFLPPILPSTLGRPNIPQSVIDRGVRLPTNTPRLPAPPASTIERGVPRVTTQPRPSIPQSGIERGAPRPTSAPRAPFAPITGRSLGDEIAMSPIQGGRQTVPPMDDVQLVGSNLGWMMDSGLLTGNFDIGTGGQKPATRVVQSVPMPPAITMRDITPAQEQAMIYRNGGPTRPQAAPPRMDPVQQGAGSFGTLAGLLGTTRPPRNANPPSGVFRTTTPALAGSALMPPTYRPNVNVPTMPTSDGPQSGANWSDFTTTFRPAAPKPDWIPLGNVMESQAPRLDSPGSPTLWQTMEAFNGQPGRTRTPPAAPPPAAAPRPAAPAAPTYRTVMQPTQVENPAYTAWKAANLGASNKPIPLGDVMNPRSRDSVANAAAGANFVATQMPERWKTVMKPVQVAVTPPRPVAPPPVAAPAGPKPMLPSFGQPPGMAAPPRANIPRGPTGVIGLLRNTLGLTSAQAYDFANSANRPMSVGDRLSGGASGGGDIGRGPSIDRVAGPHVAALHRR